MVEVVEHNRSWTGMPEGGGGGKENTGTDRRRNDRGEVEGRVRLLKCAAGFIEHCRDIFICQKMLWCLMCICGCNCNTTMLEGKQKIDLLAPPVTQCSRNG